MQRFLLPRLGWWSGLAFLLAAPALAADAVSPKADAVAVTVYNDAGQGLAMVTETRVIDLPVGQSRLVFEGVADGIMPETAMVEGLPARTVEQNFDFDLLSPGSLLEHSVGQHVTLVRTNRVTGRETRQDAVIRSGPNGAVLDLGDHVEALKCSGETERLVFDAAPPGLASTPTLSMIARAQQPGRHTVRLSYLTTGLAWKANYVAHLAPDNASLRLAGWVTLSNTSHVTFPQAKASFVAGDLARVWRRANFVRAVGFTPSCWPQGNSHHPHAPLSRARMARLGMLGGYMEDRLQKVPVAISAFAPAPPPAQARQENLGDYKLYVLPFDTTLAARQTKQVAFLDLDGVKVRKTYVYWTDRYAEREPAPANVVLALDNTADAGLGKPLPAGDVSLRLAGPNGELYGGQGQQGNIAVGQPFEWTVGKAADIVVANAPAHTAKPQSRQDRRAWDLHITNASSEDREVQIRLGPDFARATVTRETRRHERVMGQVTWRVKVAAGGSADLSYAVREP